MDERSGQALTADRDIIETIQRLLSTARKAGWDTRAQRLLTAFAVRRAIPTISETDAIVLVSMVQDGFFRRIRRIKKKRRR